MVAKEVFHKCEMTWWFGGILTLIIAITTVTTNNVIANDKDSRARDSSLSREVGLKLDTIITSQSMLSSRLSRIEGKLENDYNHK